jgi:hypothetical protein
MITCAEKRFAPVGVVEKRGGGFRKKAVKNVLFQLRAGRRS